MILKCHELLISYFHYFAKKKLDILGFLGGVQTVLK